MKIGSGQNPPKRGRPRQPAVEDAIHRATIELLIEVGVDGTTTNAIVARSGCSKSTIYRRWPSRDALILDALRTAMLARPADIRDGLDQEARLGSSVRAAARRGVKAFDDRLFRAVFPTVAREMLTGGEIGRQYRTDVYQPIRASAVARLDEAVERGEIDASVDRELLFDLIYGGLLYRTLFGSPIDVKVADDLAELVLRGAGGSRTRGT